MEPSCGRILCSRVVLILLKDHNNQRMKISPFNHSERSTHRYLGVPVFSQSHFAVLFFDADTKMPQVFLKATSEELLV